MSTTRASEISITREHYATLLADKARLDHLEELIRQCPHAEFFYSDDEANEEPLGFSITVDGCDTSQSVGKTLREAIDEDRKLIAQRNSE